MLLTCDFEHFQFISLKGQVLECSLAKPQASDQKSTGNSNSSAQTPGMLPNFPPPVNYGFVGGGFGASPGFPQVILCFYRDVVSLARSC